MSDFSTHRLLERLDRLLPFLLVAVIAAGVLSHFTMEAGSVGSGLFAAACGPSGQSSSLLAVDCCACCWTAAGLAAALIALRLRKLFAALPSTAVA